MEVRGVGDHVSIEENDTLLLFNTIDSGLYRVEPITQKLLILIKKYGIEAAKSLIKEEDTNNVAEEKIAELRENKFLDSQPEFIFPETVPITVASLNVSHDCNLKCRYCYGKGGTYQGKKCYMSREIGELSIDRLFEWSNKSKTVGITFFGGEPLLNMDLIEHLVQYSIKKGQAEGKRLQLSMTSNGTLFTDKIIDFLNKNSIGVLVSMDGPRKVQDVNRPFISGKGSYDVIAANVKRLIATRKSVTARATLTKDCLSLDTIVNGLREVGFTYVHTEPLAPDENCSCALSEGDFEILKKEYDQLGRAFLEQVLRGNPFGFSNILRTTSTIYRSAVRHYPCGAGKNLVAIDPYGGIYMCHRFTGMEDFSLGTVYDPDFSLQKKILKIHVNTRKMCQDCWAKHLCGGGCWHENYMYTGYIDEPHNPRCSLFKHIAALSMVIFSKLHEEDKELLDTMFRKNEPLYRRGEFPEENERKEVTL